MGSGLGTRRGRARPRPRPLLAFSAMNSRTRSPHGRSAPRAACPGQLSTLRKRPAPRPCFGWRSWSRAPPLSSRPSAPAGPRRRGPGLRQRTSARSCLRSRPSRLPGSSSSARGPGSPPGYLPAPHCSRPVWRWSTRSSSSTPSRRRGPRSWCRRTSRDLDAGHRAYLLLAGHLPPPCAGVLAAGGGPTRLRLLRRARRQRRPPGVAGHGLALAARAVTRRRPVAAALPLRQRLHRLHGPRRQPAVGHVRRAAHRAHGPARGCPRGRRPPRPQAGACSHGRRALRACRAAARRHRHCRLAAPRTVGRSGAGPARPARRAPVHVLDRDDADGEPDDVHLEASPLHLGAGVLGVLAGVATLGWPCSARLWSTTAVTSRRATPTASSLPAGILIILLGIALFTRWAASAGRRSWSRSGRCRSSGSPRSTPPSPPPP